MKESFWLGLFLKNFSFLLKMIVLVLAEPFVHPYEQFSTGSLLLFDPKDNVAVLDSMINWAVLVHELSILVELFVPISI
jgi:hypothetical protein